MDRQKQFHRLATALIRTAVVVTVLLAITVLPTPARGQQSTADASVGTIRVDGDLVAGTGGSATVFNHAVAHDTDSTIVIVAPTDTTARVTFTGAVAGVAQRTVALDPGANEVLFSITATAADSTTVTAEYALRVNRAVNDTFGWNAVKDFYDLDGQDAGGAEGIWSDHTHIWVASTQTIGARAFLLSTRARNGSKDVVFANTATETNINPRGIWSDGTTMWVADDEDDKIYAYELASNDRQTDKDFDTLSAAGNEDPTGIWSDGETMWVIDGVDSKIYAYWLSDQSRRPGHDFDTLDGAGNHAPWGLWSDGVTMWVTDRVNGNIYGYRMSDRSRDTSKDFGTLEHAGNRDPHGVWSDGETMYVVDEVTDTVFAYNLAEPGLLHLTSLTVNDGNAELTVPGTAWYADYGITLPELTPHLTITAQKANAATALTYSHGDDYPDVDGHQVALDESDPLIEVTVSAEGQPTVRTYRIQVTTPDAPAGDTTKAFLQVDEDGGAVHHFRGWIGQSRDTDWVNISLDGDQLFAIVLKGRNYGDTDRTLHVPYLGGLLTMGVYQEGTDALGTFVLSGTDGRAQVLFKPAMDGDFQVVVAGALAEQVGSYDLRVRPYEDDHFPNSVESESEITFPEDSGDSDAFPSASATGKIDYTFDSDWFKASDLVPGDEYVIEARHGRHHLYIKIYDSDGDLVESVYDRQRTVFVPPADDEYFIRVYPGNRFNRANYTLYVHTLPLTGDTVVGSELSVSPDNITDPDGTTVAHTHNAWRYRWFRMDLGGSESRIRRANTSTHTLTGAEGRHRVRAQICYIPDNWTRTPECRTTGWSALVEPLVTVPHNWSRIPTGLSAGDRFRLLFVSTDTRDARPTDIAAYNTWIRRQASRGHTSIQDYSEHFAILGSTRHVSAKENTVINFNDDYAGVPIYWLGGQKAADDYADFCDGSWDHRNPGTESDGDAITFTRTDVISTGTLSTCEKHSSRPLGAGTVIRGQPSDSGEALNASSGGRNVTTRLYGLSYMFEVGESGTQNLEQANRPASGQVAIAGLAQVGETLVANSAITDADGTSEATYGYQWFAGNDEITGATSITYTLTAAEQGQQVTVTVSFTDDAGNEESLTSEPTATVTAGPNSAATGQPTITGTAEFSQTLSAGTTEIADANGLDNVSYQYQWLADDSPIMDASGVSYTLTLSEVGKAIKVQVSFTDDAGHSESLTSEATEAVPNPLNYPAAELPVITGTPEVSRTLAVDTSAIADPDGLEGVSYGYRWMADGVEIADATGSTLTLTSREVERAISVKVEFTDDGGNEESRTSAATVAVGPDGINTPATGQPTIAGLPLVGVTLRAGTGAIADADGLTNAVYAHQWLADGVDIPGATRTAHTVDVSHEGKAIKVRVAFHDDKGHRESLTSEAVIPPRPADLQAAMSGNAVVLSWNPPTGFPFLFDYRIMRHRPGQGESTPTVLADTRSRATSYTDEDVTPGVLYEYHVWAVNMFNNLSAPSLPARITTPPLTEPEDDVPTEPPPAPTNLTGTSNTAEDRHVVLSWTAPDDDHITGYRILRRMPRRGQNTLLEYVSDTGSAVTTYTDGDVVAEELYVYRVKAINAAGVGPQSNYVNVEP